MGRPSLGKQAKTKVISIRVTEAQARALAERFGSPTRALRALIATVTTQEKS